MRRVLIALTAMILVLQVPAQARTPSPPEGVDDLRGRWEVTANDGAGGSIGLRLFVQDVVPGAEADTYVGAGCMTTLESGGSAPLALQAKVTGPATYDVTIYSSIVPVFDPPYIARFDGEVATHLPGVVDEEAGGAWTTGGDPMEWSGSHHDRRRPRCPGVDLDGGFFFGADLYVASDVAGGAASIYESFTNIVSGGVLVELPSGDTMVLPGFTDLFSPFVDFVSEFRYLDVVAGTPTVGSGHVFRLLDAVGNPIAGAVFTDYWFGCEQGAPVGVTAVQSGTAMPVDVAWTAVPDADGFDPDGGGPGFYQMSLDPETGDGSFGAAGMLTTTHEIPWASFTPGDPGTPDGVDFGIALNEFTDGDYQLTIIAFAESPASRPGTGLECQVRDSSEALVMTKTGDDVAFSPVP